MQVIIGLEVLEAGQAAINSAQQLGFVEGLGEVVVGAQGHATAQVEALGFGGEEDEGHPRQLRVLIKNLEHAVAVEHGHHDVAHQQVGLGGQGLGEFLDDASAVGNLSSLSADRKVHAVRKKQDVYLEGDEPTRVYFVQAGRVKTVKTTDGGKELITGLYGPGEFFGYLALLDHTPHTDSAVAVDDAELVYIPQDDFTQLLLRNAAVGQQFIRLLAGRVREREAQLLAMAYSSIRRRVADVLLRLHEQAGESGCIQLSRDDMAALVGTAPESLIRTLSEFKADGLLELTPKNIRLLEPEKLRRSRW